MSKIAIDYSNTIIYKITCKDPSITDTYVGHTTNFVQRKHAHKNTCINEKSSNYNCKLYKTIRTNGGWDNWNMEIVTFFKCNDQYEARIKEQEYFILLNATLNSIEPIPKVIKYFCETCNISLQKPHLIDLHNETKKHLKKSTEDTEKTQKNIYQYVCEFCDFKCCKKCDWDRHIIRQRHSRNVNMIQNQNDTIKNAKNINEYICECGKEYKHHSGLWRHKQVCCANSQKDEKNIKICEEPSDKDLIMLLIKENSELKNMMMKVIENGTTNKVTNLQ